MAYTSYCAVSKCTPPGDADNTTPFLRPHDELVAGTLHILRPGPDELKVEAPDNGRHDDVHLGPGETMYQSCQISTSTKCCQLGWCTYCMPRQILVPREKGANALSDLFASSVQRSGSKVFGLG